MTTLPDLGAERAQEPLARNRIEALAKARHLRLLQRSGRPPAALG